MPSLLVQESVELLKLLIATPSLSKEEEGTAGILEEFFLAKGIKPHRKKNNVWVYNKNFDKLKPTILLNSHHDTVKPNPGYTRNPFIPEIEAGKLFGLGSNDAGASLVALTAAFLSFYERNDLKYNILLAVTAEEEISGKNGMLKVLAELPKIDFAIVGEPTSLQMAIAEKGLMVVDCKTIGKAGHAARDEGENAIYKAIEDILWLKNYHFQKVSETLGPVKMTVTLIKSGTQHNVIPANCEFTIDIRTTDAYTNEEVLAIIKQNISSEAKARSTRLKPSAIGKEHILVKAAKELGIKTYGSPTLSDQALLNVPSVKIGPGKSSRSHTADEYIGLDEIKEGIELYKNLLEKIL
jgi:acetylornithine deacetylase